MSTQDQEPINEYVITETPVRIFPYTFLIVDVGELEVFKDGNLVPRNLIAYTVSDVGNANGGNITFAPNFLLEAGEKIRIIRNTVIERISDYSNLGDVTADSLNEDEDKQLRILQEIKAFTLSTISSVMQSIYTPLTFFGRTVFRGDVNLESGSRLLFEGREVIQTNLNVVDQLKFTNPIPLWTSSTLIEDQLLVYRSPEGDLIFPKAVTPFVTDNAFNTDNWSLIQTRACSGFILFSNEVDLLAGVSLGVRVSLKSGDKVFLENRNAMFTIASTGTANGFDFVQAPNSMVAELNEDSFINNFKAYGAVSTNDYTTNIGAVQRALDVAPLGSTLVISDLIPLSGESLHLLTLSRNVNIIGVPRRGIFRLDFVGNNTSFLNINITVNGGFLDVRNWFFEGVSVLFNGGGKHALDFTGGFVINSSYIGNNQLGVGTNVDASSIEVGSGTNIAHSEIRLNTFSGKVNGRFGDANLFEKNLSFGNFIAYVFDLEAGVYNNTVRGCTIVSRDGALHVIDGETVRFINNQVEQLLSSGENQAPIAASVYVEGRTRISRGHVIEANNMGGGTNVNYSVYLDNAQSVTIAKNTFTPTDIVDLFCSSNSKYNIYEFDNTILNSISEPRPDDLFKILIDNRSGFNMQMPFDFVGQNGWSNVSKAFYKAKDGRVIFIKPISGGTSVSGTIVGNLPFGTWPTEALFPTPVIDVTGVMGNVTIPSTNGVMSIGSVASNGGFMVLPFQSTTDSGDF